MFKYAVGFFILEQRFIYKSTLFLVWMQGPFRVSASCLATSW